MAADAQLPDGSNCAEGAVETHRLRPDVQAVISTDRGGRGARLQSATLPTYGTLSWKRDHEIVYTPAPGFLGRDSFSYTVWDEDENIVMKTIVVEVAP